jgi:hypothetical protein
MESITDDQLRKIVHESHSWIEVTKNCGLKTITRSLQRRVDRLKVDVSHFDKYFDGKHTKFNKFTKEEIELIVKANTKWIDIMKSLQYTSCNHVIQVQKKLDKLEIDYSHVDTTYDLPRLASKSLSEILVTDSIYMDMTTLKTRLKRELGWAHICFTCKNTTWNDQPIPIQIDHINGVHTDNRIENLRFLCPNCHAQTDTYAGKNTRVCREKKKLLESNALEQSPTDPIVTDSNGNIPTTPKPTASNPPKYVCCDCNKAVRKSATRCLDCYAKHKVTTRMVERPSLEQLEKDVEEMPMVKVGEKYGVTDNCIRKWIRHYHKIAEKS